MHGTGSHRNINLGREMEEVKETIKSVLTGAKDSVVGVWPVIYLLKNNEKIKKQLLQCFLLNGVILGLALLRLVPLILFTLALQFLGNKSYSNCGPDDKSELSILMFDYVVLPVIQYLAQWMYGVVSDPSESGILPWLGIILSYTFTGFWVLPIFWISKPINSIWFQDIASLAFDESKKQQKQSNKRSVVDNQPLSQLISRLIADFLFSVVMEALFLFQAMVVGLVPGVGSFLSLLHMAMLYALYCFEYKWIYQGWIIHHRVNFVEKNWPYFLGFGLPLAILTAMPSSLVISACIFSVTFPLFILSANEARPRQSRLSQVPIFKIVVIITNKLFNRTPQPPSVARTN